MLCLFICQMFCTVFQMMKPTFFGQMHFAPWVLLKFEVGTSSMVHLYVVWESPRPHGPVHSCSSLFSWISLNNRTPLNFQWPFLLPSSGKFNKPKNLVLTFPNNIYIVIHATVYAVKAVWIVETVKKVFSSVKSVNSVGSAVLLPSLRVFCATENAHNLKLCELQT